MKKKAMWLIAAAVFAADRVTKILAGGIPPESRKKPLQIPGFLVYSVIGTSLRCMQGAAPYVREEVKE